MNKQILAIFLMCCVQFGFGGYSVILEVYGKGHINPVVFSLFRDSCAFPILLTAAALIEGIRFPKMKDLPLFLSMGFIGIFGNQVLFILGLYAAGADIASIFQPSTPVLTVIVALVVGVERMPLLCGRKKDDRRQQDDGRSMVSGWLKIGGIILVFAGGCVMVITAPKKNATKTNAIFLGEVLLLLNCLCMACYVLIQKKYIFNNNASDTWKHTPINVTAWSYMFGAIFMSIASIYCALTQEGVFDLFPQSLPPCHSRKLNVTITNAWCDAHSGTNYNSTVKQLCECDTVDYGSFLIPFSYAAFISSSMGRFFQNLFLDQNIAAT